MPNSHITSLNVFFNYLKNKLSYKEKHAFEKKMMQDSFESDAHEGFMQYDEEIINSDLKYLKQRLHQKKKNKYIYLKIAASLLIIVSISVFLFQIKLEDKKLLSDNINREVPNENDIEKIPSVKVPELANENEDTELHHDEIVSNLKPKKLSKKSVKKKPVIVEESYNKEILADDINTSLTKNQENIKELITDDTVSKIDDVNVIGYGTVKNKTITGSVSTISPSEKKLRNKGVKESHLLKGKVVDEAGMPLPGVTVNIKGTSKGTITNIDGVYEIAGVDSSSILQYAFIGYKSQETTAGKVGEEVSLEPSLMALEEVVAVGYGTEIKESDSSVVPAKPKGGFGSYKKYISENLVYPDVPIKKKHVVIFKLKIGLSGKIIDFKVVKSHGEEFTQEAIRVLKSAPTWIPAKRNGINVESEVSFRVVFKVKKH